MKTIGRIAFGIFGLFLIYKGITDEQALGSKIAVIVGGLVLIYCIINENNTTMPEEFWNENKECILPFWKRILIVTIDVLLVIVILSLISGLTTAFTQIPIRAVFKKDPNLFLFPALVLYYTCSEAIFGSTIGKTIFGAKVFYIGKDISSLSSRIDRFTIAFKRCILRFHPLNIICLFTLKPIFYQDLFSSTISLSKSKFMENFYEETKAIVKKTEKKITPEIKEKNKS
jgi:hypothetical protein